jgi:hypothetical protein
MLQVPPVVGGTSPSDDSPVCIRRRRGVDSGMALGRFPKGLPRESGAVARLSDKKRDQSRSRFI